MGLNNISGECGNRNSERGDTGEVGLNKGRTEKSGEDCCGEEKERAK